MPKYLFKQGYYYLSGVDRPMLVPEAMLKEGIEDMGFRVIAYDEAEKVGCGRSANFTPPGKCGDDWDWIGLAQRTGPTQSLDVPDRVWWIYEYPLYVGQRPAPPAQPGQPQPQPPPTQQQPQQPPWQNPVPAPKANAIDTAKATVKADFTVPAIILGSLGGLLVARWMTKG